MSKNWYGKIKPEYLDVSYDFDKFDINNCHNRVKNLIKVSDGRISLPTLQDFIDLCIERFLGLCHNQSLLYSFSLQGGTH